MNKTSRVRIRKVEMKSGGKIELLTPSWQGETDELARRLSANAEKQRDCMGDDLAGWALVSWDRNGGFYEAYGTHSMSPIGETLMPVFVREVLRRRCHRDDSRRVMSDFLRGD